jgi:hypothetical protein
MPRACTVCANPERAVIDTMIAESVPYLQIATKFGLNQRTVNTHGKNHVKPLINAVNQEAHDAVVAKILTYRDQVNLPLSEKARFVEDTLWKEYENAETIGERVSVVKEIRGFVIEQAKLSGAYLTPQENPANVNFIAESFVNVWLARCTRLHRDYGVPMPSSEEIAAEARRYAEGNKVDPKQLIDKIAQISKAVN